VFLAQRDGTIITKELDHPFGKRWRGCPLLRVYGIQD
jgi:hypothetical protein